MDAGATLKYLGKRVDTRSTIICAAASLAHILAKSNAVRHLYMFDEFFILSTLHFIL